MISKIYEHLKIILVIQCLNSKKDENWESSKFPWKKGITVGTIPEEIPNCLSSAPLLPTSTWVPLMGDTGTRFRDEEKRHQDVQQNG